MDGGSDGDSEARFAAYVEQLGTALGHADRQEPLHDYCLGLLMPIERKSVEPMAAVTAPAQVAAKHQSLLHFVGNAPWLDAAMLAKVGELVLPAIERSGPVEAWIIDDTGFPKKGRHSVGVTRQYGDRPAQPPAKTHKASAAVVRQAFIMSTDPEQEFFSDGIADDII